MDRFTLFQWSVACLERSGMPFDRSAIIVRSRHRILARKTTFMVVVELLQTSQPHRSQIQEWMTRELQGRLVIHGFDALFRARVVVRNRPGLAPRNFANLFGRDTAGWVETSFADTASPAELDDAARDADAARRRLNAVSDRSPA